MNLKTTFSMLTVIGLVSLPAYGVRIYGSDVIDDNLLTLDTASLTGEIVGPFGIPSGAAIAGMAYDSVSDVLYGVTSNLGAPLFTIDQDSGAVTQLAQLGGQPRGAAFDTNRGRLYVTDGGFIGSGLYRYDVATGVYRQLGGIGTRSPEGLAFDPDTDLLYVLDDQFNRVISIDTTTIQPNFPIQTTILPNDLEPGLWRGLTYDTTSGMLFATRVNSGGTLTAIDPHTGMGTDVGQFSGNGNFNSMHGLAPVPEPSSSMLGLIGLCTWWIGKRCPVTRQSIEALLYTPTS